MQSDLLLGVVRSSGSQLISSIASRRILSSSILISCSVLVRRHRQADFGGAEDKKICN